MGGTFSRSSSGPPVLFFPPRVSETTETKRGQAYYDEEHMTEAHRIKSQLLLCKTFNDNVSEWK